jgi:hypothetical protein
MNARVLIRWSRVLWRSRRPLFVRRVVSLWVALGAVYAVFEQAIRPFDLMRDLAALTPTGRVVVAGLVVAAWSAALGGHARALLYDRALAPAWRAPFSRAHWAALLTPYLLLLALPLAAAGLLWPAPREPHALAFVTLSAPALAAAGGSGPRALAWWLASCLFAALTLLVALSFGSAPPAWAAALVASCLSLALASWAYDDLRGRVGARGVRAVLGALARPRGPHGALLWRDAICLWRTERAATLGALAAVTPLAAFVFAVGRHGGPVGTTTAALCALASPLGALWLVRLTGRLGDDGLAPRRHPLSPTARLATLAALVNLPLALLVLLSLGAANGWTWPQLAIALSPLPVYALAPIACTLWVRWWSNAGHLVPFAALAGFFLTRLPTPAALAVGALSGAALTHACGALLTRARDTRR